MTFVLTLRSSPPTLGCMKDTHRMHPAVRLAHRLDAAINEGSGPQLAAWLVGGLAVLALASAVWGWLGL